LVAARSNEHDPLRREEIMARRSDRGDTGRRGFLRVIGLGTAAVGASPFITACASGGLKAGTRDAVISFPVGGSDEPYPIPWLDKNGSHNQAGPRLEPSHVFHFKGRIARSADFVGSGVDGSGERLAFGLATTDNSFMDGECWTSQRRVRTGAWAHL
jgi:hypothetical protein